MNVVITTLLTSTPDPQRGTFLASDTSVLETLRVSLRSQHLVVLHDCLNERDTDRTTFVRVPPGQNPYFHRWQVIADYLNSRADLVLVWCVDGTDVRMLHDPFEHMRSTDLYVGSEDSTVGVEWMRHHHPTWSPFIEANAGRRLLNAGLLGGTAWDVAHVASAIAKTWPVPDLTDMAAFNQVVYEDFPHHVTGDVVHTPYKQYVKYAKSWWAHK